MRLDVLLVQRGLAESRQKAQAIIEAGCVMVDGKNVTKSSAAFDEDVSLRLEGQLPLQYVGRGGLKMEGALDAFGLDPTGWTAADIGASTGGFTDCLLQRGAAKVFAVDSGRGQLHPSLLADERVISMEECNAKTLSADLLGQQVDLVVMDVSFTSQVPLYGAVLSILHPHGAFISLVKPQFEVGRSGVGKKGIVRDRKLQEAACLSVLAQAEAVGLFAQDFVRSPITGGDGNTEFLALFRTDSPRRVTEEQVRRCVHCT